MSSLVLDFKDIDKTKLKLVGGKGANLGELLLSFGLNTSVVAFTINIIAGLLK